MVGRSLLVAVIGLGLSVPAFAQPKTDAGSGPTKGAVSTDDAGSGPTKGAKLNADTTATETKDSTANSAGGVQSRPGARNR